MKMSDLVATKTPKKRTCLAKMKRKLVSLIVCMLLYLKAIPVAVEKSGSIY